MRKITKNTIALLTGIIALTATTLGSAKPVHAALLSTNNEAAVAYYYALPGAVRYKLETRGVNFAVNDYAVDSLSASGRAVGVTYSNYKARSYQLVSQEVYVKYGYEDSILHEAGHCMASYNNIYDYWTNCVGWDTIYRAEVGNATAAGMSSTNLYNRDEFFAESFELYVKNPQALQAYCPQAFSYVQAVIMAP